MKPILVVDDEPHVRAVISHWAQTFGYVTREAPDAAGGRVAIAYQGMLTHRPHRASLPSSEAVLELWRCRDAQFDPVVVEAFVQMLTAH